MILSIIFAVQPDRRNPESVLYHTIPYINFKLAMCILQMAVVWFGAKVAWKDLKVQKYFIAVSWLHLIFQFPTMVISNVVLVNAISDLGPAELQGKGLWWDVHDDETLKLVTNIFGNWASFFLNVLLPLAQSQYLSCISFKDISATHAVIVTISDNREGKFE